MSTGPFPTEDGESTKDYNTKSSWSWFNAFSFNKHFYIKEVNVPNKTVVNITSIRTEP